jgi:ATP-binding cassette subfamily F protein 3
MLAIDSLTVRIAGREIIAGASANLPAGRRIGLVGRNGAGKSTLLRVIQGELTADGGNVAWPRGWKIGAVAQEAPGGPESLVDTVLAADTERARLMAAAESETDPHTLGDV